MYRIYHQYANPPMTWSSSCREASVCRFHDSTDDAPCLSWAPNLPQWGPHSLSAEQVRVMAFGLCWSRSIYEVTFWILFVLNYMSCFVIMNGDCFGFEPIQLIRHWACHWWTQWRWRLPRSLTVLPNKNSGANHQSWEVAKGEAENQEVFHTNAIHIQDHPRTKSCWMLNSPASDPKQSKGVQGDASSAKYTQSMAHGQENRQQRRMHTNILRIIRGIHAHNESKLQELRIFGVDFYRFLHISRRQRIWGRNHGPISRRWDLIIQ